MNFYSAASQVIPVLFLAMLFESRFLDREPDTYSKSERDAGNPARWNISQAVARWWTVAILVNAEIFALAALDSGRDDRVMASLVWGGVVVGLGGVALPVMGRQWGYVRLWLKSGARADWWWLVLIVGLLAYGTWGWVAMFSSL